MTSRYVLLSSASTISLRPYYLQYDGDYFAVKELRGREEDHRKEASILRKVSDSHSHVICLLATYEHGNCFGLIFPWAKCDLLTYWTTENRIPDRSIKTVLWMIRQCLGIVDGLEHVHRFVEPTDSVLSETEMNSTLAVSSASFPQSQTVYSLFGRHGDIKPANLLWFPNASDPNDMGTIKISDFGTAEFGTTESHLSSSGSVSFSPPYRPPESDLPNFAPTGSYDVWMLGCLFLEFITWYIGGRELLQKLGECKKKITSNSDHVHTFFEIIEHERPACYVREVRVKPEIQDVCPPVILSLMKVDTLTSVVYPETAQ
jgi:serine/threonine protein kinase